jgi:hypothetical protein
MNSGVVLSQHFLRAEEPIPSGSGESGGAVRIRRARPERGQAAAGRCAQLASLSLSQALEIPNTFLCRR